MQWQGTEGICERDVIRKSRTPPFPFDQKRGKRQPRHAFCAVLLSTPERPRNGDVPQLMSDGACFVGEYCAEVAMSFPHQDRHHRHCVVEGHGTHDLAARAARQSAKQAPNGRALRGLCFEERWVFDTWYTRQSLVKYRSALSTVRSNSIAMLQD